MEEKLKRIILESLLEKGVTRSNDGTPIEDLGLRQLKEVAVLQSFRQIDVESSDNAWF